MSKKKDKPRPKFECPAGHMMWVSHEKIHCTICKAQGLPMNEGAVKILRRGE
jgi:hypothetical protein